MAAKRIQVSDDNGVNWYTLPGSSGDMRRELATVGDTIFGQEFGSEDVQIGNWMVTANSYFKGVSGYKANIKQGGTPIAMTTEATTLVSGKTYQINNVARRLIDLVTTLTVFDTGVNQTANVHSIDYLNGTVTFKSTYTVGGAVTITGAYVPATTIGRGRSFTLTQGAAEIDDTDYETARANGGWRTYDPGLKSVRIEFSGIYDVTQALQQALANRTMLYIEVSPADDANTIFRGYFKRTNLGQSGDVGALEEMTTAFSLFVPDGALIERPFGWYFAAASSLNIAVRKVLASWQASLDIDVRYLPDGLTGFQGDAITTEATLSNTMEGQNEFRFTFRGSGTPAVVA